MNRTAFPMLMLALSLAPALCWAAEPTAKQARAIAEIKKLGGKVTVDEKSPDKPVIGVDLSRTKLTDAALEHLEGLTNLRSLDLTNSKVTDVGLKHLIGLTNLQSLELWDTQVTDAGMEHLEGLTNLSKLSLGYANVI